MMMPYGAPSQMPQAAPMGQGAGMGQAGGVMPTLDPMKRAQLAQALAGQGNPMSPMIQAMAMRQQQAARPQMISPGTSMNGGWSTSLEQAPGAQSGLLQRLQTMFGSGAA
jgi:hypothetical protein